MEYWLMRTLIRRLLEDRSGPTAIEYGLIAALIAVVHRRTYHAGDDAQFQVQRDRNRRRLVIAHSVHSESLRHATGSPSSDRFRTTRSVWRGGFAVIRSEKAVGKFHARAPRAHQRSVSPT